MRVAYRFSDFAPIRPGAYQAGRFPDVGTGRCLCGDDYDQSTVCRIEFRAGVGLGGGVMDVESLNLAIKSAVVKTLNNWVNKGKPLFTDGKGRMWHILMREDGTISVYYSRKGIGAIFVVYDDLNEAQS